LQKLCGIGERNRRQVSYIHIREKRAFICPFKAFIAVLQSC